MHVKGEGAAVAAPVWQGGVPLRLKNMGPVNMGQKKRRCARFCAFLTWVFGSVFVTAGVRLPRCCPCCALWPGA
jgi:hypothetical protein